VRVGATWTNETHAGRRERALEFKIFAGAVAAIMAVRQKNAEGAVYSPPFVGKVMLQVGGAFGIGPQHRPRRRH
jgi:hypothetical protein